MARYEAISNCKYNSPLQDLFAGLRYKNRFVMAVRLRSVLKGKGAISPHRLLRRLAVTKSVWYGRYEAILLQYETASYRTLRDPPRSNMMQPYYWCV